MNNQRKAVYSERRRVLEGRELKKQVIGYRELTMEDIVEAYVNQDLQPDQLLGLSVEELTKSPRHSKKCSSVYVLLIIVPFPRPISMKYSPFMKLNRPATSLSWPSCEAQSGFRTSLEHSPT
jgi:hypothetical protein